jgi:hypothetical protein
VARGIFTNLDLHQDVPLRAQPKAGEWGPALVPTSRAKRVIRRLVPILAGVAVTAILVLGYLVFRVIAQAVGL